jgi:hypothetical protein
LAEAVNGCRPLVIDGQQAIANEAGKAHWAQGTTAAVLKAKARRLEVLIELEGAKIKEAKESE